MRAIKFKAKDLDGIWVYGSYDSYNIAIIDDAGAKHYIEPETICQYVGITDRNGNDIYEDDIIRTPRGSRGRVVFCDLSWMVMWEENPLYQYLCYSIGRIEVTGNIHDSNHDYND